MLAQPSVQCLSHYQNAYTLFVPSSLLCLLRASSFLPLRLVVHLNYSPSFLSHSSAFTTPARVCCTHSCHSLSHKTTRFAFLINADDGGVLGCLVHPNDTAQAVDLKKAIADSFHPRLTQPSNKHAAMQVRYYHMSFCGVAVPFVATRLRPAAASVATAHVAAAILIPGFYAYGSPPYALSLCLFDSLLCPP